MAVLWLYSGCCYSCYTSQERINTSAVFIRLLLQPPSSHLAYHGFSKVCTAKQLASQTGSVRHRYNEDNISLWDQGQAG